MIKLLACILANLLRLRFYLRKFKIGYTRTNLVLDIGSGNDPHPRADILLDLKYEDVDRPFKLIKDDRPFLIGNVEALPFKDKVIDFAICDQVLEHIDKPQKALNEIARVAKRGYIETPAETVQKICDISTHKWFIRKEDNKLIFTRKKRPFYDPDIALFFHRLWYEKDLYYRIWTYSFFEKGIIRYYWKDKIDYEIFDFPESEIDKEGFKKALRYDVSIPRFLDTGIRVYIKKLIKCYYTITTSRKRRLKRLWSKKRD